MTRLDRDEFDAAEDAWQNTIWDRALVRYQAFLVRRLATQQPLTPLDVIAAERLGDLSMLFGLEGAARKLYAGAAGACADAGNSFSADYYTLKHLHLTLAFGDLEVAYELLQQLQSRTGPLEAVPVNTADLADWEKQRHWPDTGSDDRIVLLTRLYLGLGQWLAAQGYYGQAAALFQRGAAHAAAPAPDLASRAFVPLRLALAGALLEKGNLEEAHAILHESERRLDKERHPGQYVDWLELSGKLHLLAGEFGLARSSFFRIIQVCTDGEFRRAAVAAILNQAEILIVLNQVRAAEEWLKGAEAAAAALGLPAAQARAAWLSRLARARAESAAEPVPLASVTEMWKGSGGREPGTPVAAAFDPRDLPPAPNYLAFFEDRALGVPWLLSQGRTDEAVEELARLRDVFAGTDSALIRLRLRVLEGVVAYGRLDYLSAAGVLREVCPHLEALGLKHELWQAVRMLGWCAVRLDWPPSEQHALVRRADELLMEMAGSLDPARAAIFLLNKWTDDERKLMVDLEELVRHQEGLVKAPWYLRPWKRWQVWRRLHPFLERIGRHRRLLARRALAGDEQGPPAAATPSLRKRLWRHPRRRATLSFLVLPDRVFVCRAGWLSLDFTVRPMTRVRLRELVQRWHELMRDSLRPAECLKTATELAHELGLPEVLAALPRRTRTLTIQADDSLHGFPFAALPNGGRFLVEDFALHVAFDQASPPPPASGERPREGLVVAVSRGASPSPAFPRGIEPLPATPAEADSVARWLTGHGIPTQPVLDVMDRKELLERWRRAAFVHISCHGIFRPDKPDATGLLLIPRPDSPELVSLREVSDLDLTGLQHVTLAHCWSADNFILPGRWIIGLPETLCRAGAQSVLGCLWQIEDTVGQAFHQRFCELLSSQSRAEALRQTQLECLRDGLPGCKGTTSPFFWAGYQLSGDPGPLQL